MRSSKTKLTPTRETKHPNVQYHQRLAAKCCSTYTCRLIQSTKGTTRQAETTNQPAHTYPDFRSLAPVHHDSVLLGNVCFREAPQSVHPSLCPFIVWLLIPKLTNSRGSDERRMSVRYDILTPDIHHEIIQNLLFVRLKHLFRGIPNKCTATNVLCC